MLFREAHVMKPHEWTEWEGVAYLLTALGVGYLIVYAFVPFAVSLWR